MDSSEGISVAEHSTGYRKKPKLSNSATIIKRNERYV